MVEIYNVDIEIYNLDCSGLSYEGGLNNPIVNKKTPIKLDQGYVGSYHVFGYGVFSISSNALSSYNYAEYAHCLILLIT